MKHLTLFIKTFLLTFVIFINCISLVYGAEQPDAETLYLSRQLKQIVEFSAPNNQGLDYFILPDPTDLDKIPADPQNPLTPAKIELGKYLFHEPALSINSINIKHWKTVSCATCHFAQAGFRANIAQALGTGGLGFSKQRHRDPDFSPTIIDKQSILAPSVLNSAYQEPMLWDGRAGVTGINAKEPLIQEFDVNRYQLSGLETQAIDAMTVHRLGTAAIATIPEYQDLFAHAFPDRPYVSAEIEDLKRTGLAIAAYERTLLATEAPFQKWLKGDENALSKQELRGGLVFFRSTCIHCHTGANLARSDFRSVGFGDHPNEVSGLNLGRGVITKNPQDDFKFKVPQLYNLADSSPHGHGASFETVQEVVNYFNQGRPQKVEALYAKNLSILFKPLHLDSQQIDDLTTFLEESLKDPNLIRYLPQKLPSGLCFPNNDQLSQEQFNCSPSKGFLINW